MYQVETFESGDLFKLKDLINAWLAEVGDSVDIINISAARDTYYHTAMILFTYKIE